MKKLILVGLFAAVIFLAAMSPVAQGVRSADFYFDVGNGNVLNHSSVNKFGQNTDVDSAAAEDIWDGGGVWSEPTVGQVYTVTSTSANDTAAGTGARTLKVFGVISETGLLGNETISLAGTFAVTLTNNYQMIHRMVVLSAGSGNANAGNIQAWGNTDGTLTAQVSITQNQTLMAIYKIPADKKGCITNYYISVNKATGATATANGILKVKPNGEVWQTKEVIGLSKDGTSKVERDFVIPSCYDPLSIVKMTMDVSTDNVDSSAGFGLVLVPN